MEESLGTAVAALAAAERPARVAFADLGRALHDGYHGPKRLVVQERATHDTVRYDPRDPSWGEVVGFLPGR